MNFKDEIYLTLRRSRGKKRFQTLPGAFLHPLPFHTSLEHCPPFARECLSLPNKLLYILQSPAPTPAPPRKPFQTDLSVGSPQLPISLGLHILGPSHYPIHNHRRMGRSRGSASPGWMIFEAQGPVGAQSWDFFKLTMKSRKL